MIRLSHNLGLGLQVPVGPLVLWQDVSRDDAGLLGNVDREDKAGPGGGTEMLNSVSSLYTTEHYRLTC